MAKIGEKFVGKKWENGQDWRKFVGKIRDFRKKSRKKCKIFVKKFDGKNPKFLQKIRVNS